MMRKEFKKMSELKKITDRIDENQLEIAELIGKQPINKDLILTKYLCLITEIKENLFKLDNCNKLEFIENAIDDISKTPEANRILSSIIKYSMNKMNNVCNVAFDNYLFNKLENDYADIDRCDVDRYKIIEDAKETIWYKDLKNQFSIKFVDLLLSSEYELDNLEEMFLRVANYLKFEINNEHSTEINKFISNYNKKYFENSNN